MSTESATAVKPWAHQSDQEKALVERVAGCVESFEQGLGAEWKDRLDHLYDQYRGFRQLKDLWVTVDENDRDVVLNEAMDDWGSKLHIPYAFSTIETMVPQAIAQRPRMLIIPRRAEWGENAQNLRELIDRQQDAVDVELTWQDIMRSGFIYGLGVGKSFWRKQFAQRRYVEPTSFGARFGRPAHYLTPLRQVPTFDDPDLEDVDVYDFMWDPYGHSLKSCGWMMHRLWLSTEDCLYRIKAGLWNTNGAKAILDRNEGELSEGRFLDDMGGGQKYDEIWQHRMATSGMDVSRLVGGKRPHEVWEYHDGTQVITILDRQVCVQVAESPIVGMMPFQLYRPTPLQKQMVGIGEIEPIDSLIRELDTTRSMMLDAGVIAMCAGYAYDDQAIEEDDLVFGPASAIRVTNARPADALFPLPTKDLPRSAYENSRSIMADIERVTGINDALAGGDGGSISTATEAQLVQASLSKRVNLKSRRFEIEVCRTAARQWLYLNQRMTLQQRERQLPLDPSMTWAEAANVGAFRYAKLGPDELRGEFEVMAEGGTMAAENVPQMRADARDIAGLQGNPNLNDRMLLLEQMRLMGFKRPHDYFVPQQLPIPPVFRDILIKSGRVDQQTVDMLLHEANQIMQAQMPETNTPAAAGVGPEGA